MPWLTENSPSFLHGLKTSWATESPVTESRAMQRVYPRSVPQRVSPWKSTTLPARSWGPAIERCQRVSSSPNAQEEHRCAERWVVKGIRFNKGICFTVYILSFVLGPPGTTTNVFGPHRVLWSRNWCKVQMVPVVKYGLSRQQMPAILFLVDQWVGGSVSDHWTVWLHLMLPYYV